MVDLPTEIWHTIINYLPSEILQRLYAVNRVFFDRAMNEKYGVVEIEAMNTLLDRISNPHIASRVRSFSVAPDSIYVHREAKHASTVVQRVLQRGFKSKETRASDIFIQRLRSVFPLLVNVHDFRVDWTSLDTCVIPLALVWDHLGQNLERLELCVTKLKFWELLPLPIALPRLIELRITLHADEVGELTGVQLSMASFINSMKDTLRVLYVRFLPMQNLSTLYENLDHIQHLSDLDLDVSLSSRPIVSNEAVHGATTFIQKHSQTISDLRLSTSLPITPYSSYQFTYHNLQLCKLRTLTMSAEVMVISWQHTESFLSHHAPKLEALAIEGPTAPSEISRILDSLNRGSPSSALSTLSISVYQLDVHLLGILATEIPGLKTLRLHISKIGCNTMFSILPGQFFPEDLPSPPYPFITELRNCQILKHWKLHDITIQRRSCCGELVLWNLMGLLAKHVPSISSFSGQGDMSIPNPPNRRPKFDGERCASGRLQCTYGEDSQRW